MATLDRNTIKTLTQLSRIQCTEAEQEALLTDLAGVLSYIDQLNTINTDNVPPCNHVLENMSNVIREDVVGETLSRSAFLANAPLHRAGLIQFPSVLKQ